MRALRSLAATCAGLLLVACGGGGEAGPDLWVLTVDTLRYDYVSAHGAGLSSTPTLDALAARGALFTRHESVAGETAPAMATMFTGRHPSRHGLRQNGWTLDPSWDTLPARLQAAGYTTLCVTGSGVFSSLFGFERGFDVFDDEIPAEGCRKIGNHRDAGAVVDRALAHLAEAGDGPVALWTHFFDPHDPYLRPRAEWPGVDERLAVLGDRAEASSIYDLDEVGTQHAGYAAEVAYFDAELARLVDAWLARPRGAGSAIVVTADHGEGLGEHAYAGHLLYLYEEQVHVPLFVSLPGRVAPGARVEALSSSVDVTATVLDLVGLGGSPSEASRSLLPMLDGAPGRGLAIAERPVVHVNRRGNQRPTTVLLNELEGQAGGGVGELVAVVRGQWKYVWSEDAPDELYDLAADPAERANVIDAHPDLAEQLGALAEGWQAAAEASAGGEDLSLDPAVRQMLDDMGY